MQRTILIKHNKSKFRNTVSERDDFDLDQPVTKKTQIVPLAFYKHMESGDRDLFGGVRANARREKRTVKQFPERGEIADAKFIKQKMDLSVVNEEDLKEVEESYEHD